MKDGTIRDDVIIVLVDLSGSMAGTALSMVGVHISELLSELQSIQDNANNSIRLGILGFHETAFWMMGPKQVNQILDLPQFRPAYGDDQLGKKSNYAEMFKKLNECMTERFLCETRALNSVHLLLFTDSVPTDSRAVFMETLRNIKKNPVFSNSRTKRYIVRERTREIRFSGMEDYLDMEVCLKRFTSNEQNIVSSEEFPALLGNIVGELGTIEKIDSVFNKN